jgi:hypothetical protein
MERMKKLKKHLRSSFEAVRRGWRARYDMLAEPSARFEVVGDSLEMVVSAQLDWPRTPEAVSEVLADIMRMAEAACDEFGLGLEVTDENPRATRDRVTHGRPDSWRLTFVPRSEPGRGGMRHLRPFGD